MNENRFNAGHLKTLFWLGLLTLLPYVNVLQNGFVWDDKIFIIDNYPIRHPLLLFSVPLKGIFLGSRPVMFLSLALDYRIWGFNPAGFHLTNLLLHALNVLLVYLLALRVTKGGLWAPLAGLLFALHPVHCEAVASMLGRSDLLVTAISLLGLLLFHGFLRSSALFRKGTLFAGVLLSYSAVCLTKENGIVFPLLIVICENLAWRNEDRRRPWSAQVLTLVPLLVIGLLCLCFRQATIPISGQQLWGGGRWQAAMLMMVVFWKYFVLLVFPAFLSPYYILYWPEGWDYLPVLGGLFVLLGSVALLIVFHRRIPLLAWAIAWLGVTLLPVSNIIPIPGAMMNERWLYLPSVGFVILVGWCAFKILSQSGSDLRRVLWGVGSVLVLLFTVRIVSWNAVWRSDESVALKILQQHPESTLAHNNLGNYLFCVGRIPEAKQEYTQAVLLDPGRAQSHANLGNVYCAEQNWPGGIAEYRKALALDPRLAPAWYALGVAYQRQGMLDSALAQYQRVLQFDPLHVPALKGSAGILLEKKEYGLAEGYFRRALDIAPQDTELKSSLVKVLQLRSGQAR
jgi:tetratricopeptide (TPR) repeat protein